MSRKAMEPPVETQAEKTARINEGKIRDLTAKLVTENNVEKLRSLYEQTFKVAPVQNVEKDRLARKIATFVVSGSSETETTASEVVPGPPEAPVGATVPAPVQPVVVDDKGAMEALGKIRDSFEEVERLIEEKRAKGAELRQTISKSREAIQAVVTDDTIDPMKRIALIEGHWRTLCRTEEKRTALVAELNEQIKAARGTVKTVLNSVRQIPLPLGECDDE